MTTKENIEAWKMMRGLDVISVCMGMGEEMGEGLAMRISRTNERRCTNTQS